MKCVITGSNGFVAAHVIEHFLKNTDWDIVGFDKMSDVSHTNDKLMDMDTR